MLANITNFLVLLKVQVWALLLDVEAILGEAKTAAENGKSTDGITSKITEVGGGAYRILFYVLIFCGIVSVICVAIALLFSNSGTRQELKGKALWIVVAIAVGTGAVAIIGTIAGAATGMFGNTTDISQPTGTAVGWMMNYFLL